MKTNLKTATVRARIEPKIKAKAERVLRALGLSSSEAINVFYRKILAEQGMPFSLRIPNTETIKTIRSARKNVDVETFKSIAEWEKQFKL